MDIGKAGREKRHQAKRKAKPSTRGLGFINKVALAKIAWKRELKSAAGYLGKLGRRNKKMIAGFMSEPISIQEKQSYSSITSGKERWLYYA